MFRLMQEKYPSPFSLRHQVLGFAGWFLLTALAAIAGFLASVEAGEFYRQLVRPAWAPPAWLFGPVWTLLYVMMAISAWLIWRIGKVSNVYAGLLLFVLQLGANALWTWLFFAWQQGALAFVEILVLWILLAATISFFWPLQKIAAILLLPYLGWVTFASMLCLSIWLRNPVILS